jgi:hypothetical protein
MTTKITDVVALVDAMTAEEYRALCEAGDAPFCGTAPGHLCRSRETNTPHSRRIRLTHRDLSQRHGAIPLVDPAGRRIRVGPAEGDAKVWEEGGTLYMYEGRLIVNGDTLMVSLCRNITDKQLRELVAWVRTGEAFPPERPRWSEGPDGWITHVSVAVDIDKAIARCIDAHERAPWEQR